VCIANMFIAGTLMAKTQHIKLESTTDVSFSGETIAVKIIYDVDNSNKKTSGIGIRIHFDSRFIENVSLSDVYGEGMIGHNYKPQSDIDNFDGDEKTDKFINVAWASITKNWPIFLNMPGQLAVLNVKVKSNAPNGETNMNVSSMSNAAGFKFDSQSASLLVQ